VQFSEILTRLCRGESLGEELSMKAMGEIMDGRLTAAQIAAFLVALRAKGETMAEIVGCARAIRARAARFRAPPGRLIDTCGTGGDSAGTFNISTAAAFVAAGAGAQVAKHGNRAVSSRTGSADVLEALDVDISMSPSEAAEALEAVQLTFLFAPTYHAAMRHAAPVRRELGIRTVFNLLGPLCNPANASAQVIGVFDRMLLEPIAQAAAMLGTAHVMVVHGSDGLDELTVTGLTHVAEWDGTSVRQYTVDPSELGLPLRSAAELRGGDAATNARILRDVLDPRAPDSACRDIVLLNSAAALKVAGLAADLQGGLALARASIATGAALGRLQALVDKCADIRAQRTARERVVTSVPAMRAGWAY
jgi:anthranilate phosphoribosyltransferase